MNTVVLDDRGLTLGALRLTAAGGTCVGNRYPANFDVLHVGEDLPLLAVADGMGDGPGSTAAGRTAMEVFVTGASAAAADGALTTDPAGALRAVVAKVQRRVRAAGQALAGELTGCTLSALVAAPGAVVPSGWIVQLGDSRVYRRRAGLLELLTVDHTMAWLGAVNGWFPPDSRQAQAARYQLFRYAGHPDQPEADIMAVTFRPGDVYLVCTDGVAEQVDYYGLDARLAADVSPSVIAAELLADTLTAGGHDNATAAVLRVDA